MDEVPVNLMVNGQRRRVFVEPRKTLADTNNNRTRAAAALGISRVALYKKLRKHG